MKRRMFLAASMSPALTRADEPKLLLPSDKPDEYNFRIMWHGPCRPIDIATYSLKIHGLVENPLEMSLDELRKLPRETQSARLKCVQCWSSRTMWGGFRFGHLLELAKPKKDAKAVRFDCADKWFDYYTLEELARPQLLMALDMAGQPLPDRHGAPLRVLDPARYGYKSAKLVTSIEFVTESKPGMACDIGPYYSPSGDIKSGYDHPLDLGPGARKKILGGEITEY